MQAAEKQLKLLRLLKNKCLCTLALHAEAQNQVFRALWKASSVKAILIFGRRIKEIY